MKITRINNPFNVRYPQPCQGCEGQGKYRQWYKPTDPFGPDAPDIPGKAFCEPLYVECERCGGKGYL